MARTPAVEKPFALRLMGLGLLAIIAFFLWLVWSFFSQSFADYDDIKVTAAKSGLSLPQRADVKLRGMLVGVVRETKIENDQVVMIVGMDPTLIDRVPRDVRVEILPKTLFGEKYLSLVPTGSGTGEHLRAGDTLNGATVPVEVEKFLNDIYPLLTAVPPEKIAYTLSALADSLEGRGDQLGETLVEANDYLKKLNPETQLVVSDIVKLGQVSQTYSGQMQNFGKLLRNTSEVSRTIVDKEDELGNLFSETDSLSGVLNTFLEKAGDDVVATVHNSVKPLQVSAEYSSLFPCWFKSLDYLLRNRLDSLLKNKTLHIDLQMISPQPTAFDPATERPIIPSEATIESLKLTQPETHGYTPNPSDPSNPYPAGLGTICDELNAAAAGNPVRSHTNPIPIPGEYWKLVGIRNSHNGKLGTDADYQRPVASSTLASTDSPAQKKVLNRMTTALTGVKTSEVPDVASLLISPVLRGTAGVSIR